MGKIKNLTPKQKEIHEKAVKLRKMTDEQLVEQLAASNGVAKFLDELEESSPHGLGAGTFAKIRKFARSHKYIREKSETEKKETAAELERLKKENAVLQSNAKKAPPSALKERVKFHVEEYLRSFNAALEAVNALPEDEREKLQSSMKAMVAKMGEVLSK